MPLQPQQQQNFWNWLTSAVPQPACPFCKSALAQGNIGEIIEAAAVSHAGHAVHMLQLICSNCAFVSLFSIFVRGNVVNFETTVVPRRKRSPKKTASQPAGGTAAKNRKGRGAGSV